MSWAATGVGVGVATLGAGVYGANMESASASAANAANRDMFNREMQLKEEQAKIANANATLARQQQSGQFDANLKRTDAQIAEANRAALAGESLGAASLAQRTSEAAAAQRLGIATLGQRQREAQAQQELGTATLAQRTAEAGVQAELGRGGLAESIRAAQAQDAQQTALLAQRASEATAQQELGTSTLAEQKRQALSGEAFRGAQADESIRRYGLEAVERGEATIEDLRRFELGREDVQSEIGREESRFAFQQGAQDARTESRRGREDLINQGVQDQFNALRTENLARLDPYQQAGTAASNERSALLGLSGADAQAAAQARFSESPGQAFLRERQERSLLRNQAAIGGLGGGNVRTALQEQAFGRAQTDYDNQLSRLGAVANQGLSAAQTNQSNQGPQYTQTGTDLGVSGQTYTPYKGE